MKRIRRITMEIVQRRQQLLLSRQAAAPVATPTGVAADAPDLPETCSLCGSGWMLLHEPLPRPAPGITPDAASSAVPAVRAAFASLDLHLHSAPDGRMWACRRSFDQLCNRLKETV